ncbi:MAG: sulfate adenylyltransferase subunit CysD [Betaproteobacteria bacterium]
MSDHLHILEQQSIHVIREAHARLKPLAMLWSIGKDSNTLLWLVRKAFLGRVPFPVMLLDTGNEFPEVYALRDRIASDWRLDCVNVLCPPATQTDATLPPAARAAARKTLGLRQVVVERRLRGVMLGIRRDEQAVRGKERVFSPRRGDGSWDFRDQPAELWDQYQTDFASDMHVRVHPLLAWTELDVWRYIAREGIPVCELYFSRQGRRYRSLGEADITLPVESQASTIQEIIAELEQTRESERAGRTMDHESEDTFERLRVAGYM